MLALGAVLGGVILAALAASVAVAAAEPVGEIVDPPLRKQPTARQASTLYPFAAMANEKIGTSVVRCSVKADGSLTACQLVCENPEGWGFGKAGLRMARFFQLEPQLADGRPVEGGTVTLPFYFFPSFLPRPQRCDGKTN